EVVWDTSPLVVTQSSSGLRLFNSSHGAVQQWTTTFQLLLRGGPPVDCDKSPLAAEQSTAGLGQRSSCCGTVHWWTTASEELNRGGPLVDWGSRESAVGLSSGRSGSFARRLHTEDSAIVTHNTHFFLSKSVFLILNSRLVSLKRFS